MLEIINWLNNIKVKSHKRKFTAYNIDRQANDAFPWQCIEQFIDWLSEHPHGHLAGELLRLSAGFKFMAEWWFDSRYASLLASIYGISVWAPGDL